MRAARAAARFSHNWASRRERRRACASACVSPPDRQGAMTSGLSPRRLTSPKDLVEAGLAEPERLRGARGHRQALCDRPYAGAGRAHSARGPRRPDRAPVRPRRSRARPRSRRARRSDRRRRDEPGQGAGASLSRSGADQAGRGLRGLLPFLLSPRAGRSRLGARSARPSSPPRSTTCARVQGFGRSS